METDEQISYIPLLTPAVKLPLPLHHLTTILFVACFTLHLVCSTNTQPGISGPVIWGSAQPPWLVIFTFVVL